MTNLLGVRRGLERERFVSLLDFSLVHLESQRHVVENGEERQRALRSVEQPS
jgi:hypothetical protein